MLCQHSSTHILYWERPWFHRRAVHSIVYYHTCLLNKGTYVCSQVSLQPDQHHSTTPSLVGHSPAVRYATAPSITHTVHITHKRLSHIRYSPTGSEMAAHIPSWAHFQEAARPLRHRHQQDTDTPKNCSPTHPSPPKAARGARAAPRATAPTSPQRHRMVRHTAGMGRWVFGRKELFFFACTLNRCVLKLNGSTSRS